MCVPNQQKPQAVPPMMDPAATTATADPAQTLFPSKQAAAPIPKIPVSDNTSSAAASPVTSASKKVMAAKVDKSIGGGLKVP